MQVLYYLEFYCSVLCKSSVTITMTEILLFVSVYSIPSPIKMSIAQIMSPTIIRTYLSFVMTMPADEYFIAARGSNATSTPIVRTAGKEHILVNN